MTENAPLPGTCAYCQKPSQGNYSVHRDGFCEGPEVDLCDECGGFASPTLEEIWAHISTTREPPSAVAPCTCALSKRDGMWSSEPDPQCPVHGAK